MASRRSRWGTTAATFALAAVMSTSACSAPPSSHEATRQMPLNNPGTGSGHSSADGARSRAGGAQPRVLSWTHAPGRRHQLHVLERLERARVIALKKLLHKAAVESRRAALDVPFVVSSLNVLGASHTAGPHARHGYRSGQSRITHLISTMINKDVSVVGLQEFQPPQDLTFQRVAGALYHVYPGMQLGARSSDNSIAWRTSQWKLVEAHTIGIPYFGGRIRDMPYVLLQNLGSGKRIWFANFHNPANIGGNMAHWRQVALAIEARLSQTLHSTGTPVLLTGDMNDRAAFACPFTAMSGLHSANGAHSAGGRCYTPRHMDVDWILGSSDVTFSGFLSDPGPQRARLTDHPMITSTVTLP